MRFIELKICEKVGNVLEECNRICNRDSIQVLLIWLNSEIFERIVDGDVALCSQAKSYIARLFVSENKEHLESIQSNMIISNDVLYWAGYLVTYWCLEYQETAKDVLKNYDIENVIYSYDVLHSLSIKAAIEKIKEDYFRGKN